MDLPIEVVSKIMIFHSNLPFDREELFEFVYQWEWVKYVDDKRIATDEEEYYLNKIIKTNPVVRKFYKMYIYKYRYLFGSYWKDDFRVDNKRD
jgi:hypothetical protein